VTDDPGVRIDIAHAKLLEGLVCAHKPTSVLELGFGRGRSAEAILRGLDFNQQSFTYTLVDNWGDWGGNWPDEASAFRLQHPEVDIIVCDEGDFLGAPPVGTSLAYDFIMSDADHFHAHEWHDRVYDDLLNPGGVLIYHDVTQFPGLIGIVEKCVEQGLRHVVFEKNSRSDERCQRGLLVIFKPLEMSG